MVALDTVVQTIDHERDTFAKRCGGRPMATLTKLRADVHRWKGLSTWVSSGGAVMNDMGHRNRLVRVIPLQRVLARRLTLREERRRLAAVCTDNLRAAEAALHTYQSREGDGLMEILEDAASEGEGFFQMKVCAIAVGCE